MRKPIMLDGKVYSSIRELENNYHFYEGKIRKYSHYHHLPQWQAAFILTRKINRSRTNNALSMHYLSKPWTQISKKT